jgi:hypothetical protein
VNPIYGPGFENSFSNLIGALVQFLDLRFNLLKYLSVLTNWNNNLAINIL